MKALRIRTWILFLGLTLSTLLILEHVNGEGKDLSDAEAADFALSQLFGDTGGTSGAGAGGGSVDFQNLGLGPGGGFGGFSLNGGKLSCNGCGSVCRMKCGTRRFRYCCFHYVRKRKDQTLSKSQKQNQTPTRDSASGKNVGARYPAPILSLLSFSNAESEMGENEEPNRSENESNEQVKFSGRSAIGSGSEYFP